MNRRELIEATKVKLEEISSFDEPNSFIAAGNDKDYESVKPIVSYIDDTLDKATWKCLSELPLSALSEDIDRMSTFAIVDELGVGHINLINIISCPRFVRVSAKTWRRDCTKVLAATDELALLQESPYTRGGNCKPVTLFFPETKELRLYSFSNSKEGEQLGCKFYFIDCSKKSEDVKSDISDFIALQCAIYVYEILGRTDAAKIMIEEYNNKLQLLMQ